MYAVENKDCELKLEGFMCIYSPWVLLFFKKKGLKCNFILIALMKDKYPLHMYYQGINIFCININEMKIWQIMRDFYTPKSVKRIE